MAPSSWIIGRRRSSTASTSAWSPPLAPTPPVALESSAPDLASVASSRARRQSLVMKRDLYAGGERDAVRCRLGGLEGLEEILALAPVDPSSPARPPSPSRQARAASFASSSMAPHLSSLAASPTPRRRHSHQPPVSAPLVSPSLCRAALPNPTASSPTSTPARSRAVSIVKRKPVPQVALEEDVDLVAPSAWAGAACRAAPRPPPERRIDERVRQLSMDDGVEGGQGLGLRIRTSSIDGSSGSRRESSLPPASLSSSTPVSPVTSRATSSSLSRSTTASSATTYSNMSSPRPFALVRRQPQRSSSARDVLFGARGVHSTVEVDDALVDAWMDLIAGHDDEAVVRRRASVVRLAPPSWRPEPVPPVPGMRGAPRPYEPDTLAHMVTGLPPLVYAATSPRPPSPASTSSSARPRPADEPPSPTSSTFASRSSPHRPAPSPMSGTPPLPPVIALASSALEPPSVAPHRLSFLAPSLHDSDCTSDDYHSAAESSVASACSAYVEAPLAAAPTLRERRLGKRSSSSLRPSEPRQLIVDASAGASAAPASPMSPVSPASPAQPEQKRRLLSSDKPLPARPPKSAARRASIDAARLLGAGGGSSPGSSGMSRADEREAASRYVLLDRSPSTSSGSVDSCEVKIFALGHSVAPSVAVL
ncbi:hypothetical protein JCM8208_003045 [Rhodotorula glutinis]